MAPVTEVVLLTLSPGADYSVVTESLQILARQPGCLAARASRLHHDPDQVHYFIDWVAVDAHLAFARNNPVYAPFRARIGSVMAAFRTPYHVQLMPSPDVFDDAGAVAMVGKAWFPGLTPADMQRVDEAFAGFLQTLRGGGVEGFTGRAAHGWSVEDDIVYRGGRGRVFFFAVGWDCVGAWVGFRDSEMFVEMGSVIARVGKLDELEICVVDTKGSDVAS